MRCQSRANDPRSLSHVTGGDALQASTAAPFDEMKKGDPREPPLSWNGSDRQPSPCRVIAGIGMIDGGLSQHF